MHDHRRESICYFTFLVDSRTFGTGLITQQLLAHVESLVNASRYCFVPSQFLPANSPVHRLIVDFTKI